MTHASWYLARASGIVSWCILAASVMWGYVLSTKLFSGKPRPVWTLNLHRFLGGLSVIFVALHLGGLVADTYIHYGPSQLFIPLATRWHPVAVAWGVVALYFLVAVEVSSLFMKKLPRRVWLSIHRSSFVLFVLATAHLVSAGTDARGHPRTQIAAVATLALIVFLFLVRVLSPRAAARAKRAGPPAKPGKPSEAELAGSSV